MSPIDDTDVGAVEPTHKPRKTRSPAYPGIPLDVAIARARVVYEHERRHAAPIAAILGHWGYGSKSSGGFSTLAALKQYGLLEDEGSGARRKAHLTDLAFAILLDEREDSADRRESIRRAALYPGIHQELWDSFGPDLPSEASLRTHLLMDRDFTESGVKDFLPVFRRTIEFAGLLRDELDTEEHAVPITEDTARVPAAEPGVVAPFIPERPNTAPDREVQIPVTPSSWVKVRGAFPLTEGAWDQMMAILAAMKPGLTRTESDED
jgi:hypothetical protein